MTDYIFVFVMAFFLALSVWGMFSKPPHDPRSSTPVSRILPPGTRSEDGVEWVISSASSE